EMTDPGRCIAEDNGCQQEPGLAQHDSRHQARKRATRAQIMPSPRRGLRMLAQVIVPELGISRDPFHGRLVNPCNAFAAWSPCRAGATAGRPTRLSLKA